jgi:small subunit ribosomal protein S5
MKKGKAPIREVKEFEEEVIQIDRVTRVVKGGRRLRFRATVVIGNKKGKVGLGIGKSTEVTGAISKAIAQAKKDLINVPMAGQTIPHRIQVKFKSARVMLMPAIPGTGIKAGGSVRKVIELSGIKDIMGKCLGSPNRLNNSQAAIMALTKLKNIPWLKIKAPEQGTESEPVAAVRKPFRNDRKPAFRRGPQGDRKPRLPGQDQKKTPPPAAAAKETEK